MTLNRAVLVLEGGTYFIGQSVGYEGHAEGEIVFNTSMTGYQEILTDPSYKGQIVTMTYPLIGNCGYNLEDVESIYPSVEGFIVKEMANYPSNWRKKGSLSDYLKRNKIVAIQGIDTRKLTKIIRTTGAQKALISTEGDDIKTLQERVRKIPSIVGRDLVREVTTSKPYHWSETTYCWQKGYGKKSRFKYFVIAYDFGIKRNILRNLISNNIDVLVVPAATSWTEILKMKPDGVLLSNGPGDPAPLSYAIENIKNLIGKVPIFGICLGHQLLAIALGGRTYKLKFAHRGANHPVKNLET
ncbi:MAG: glutamine-hydrolyzing carbamoyl-phosphate synthase small subunit, partial [Acidobacteriota bacterium]|nr:glutamine-hydrolyzing carbamoyl-phosphate synthase small subunit [Acidobacteriota bacterium]